MNSGSYTGTLTVIQFKVNSPTVEMASKHAKTMTPALSIFSASTGKSSTESFAEFIVSKKSSSVLKQPDISAPICTVFF